jgi:hypothetical protein
LDEPTKVFFFFVILFSNLAFLIYWGVMMYLEVKSMLIKKLGRIYALVCLCGNMEKLDKIQKDIKIKEDNETLREKYDAILEDLQKLYNEGTLILNDRNIEKVHVYLERDKVLKAAGIDLNYISVKEREKLNKRYKRKFINQNENMQVLHREIAGDKIDESAIEFGFEPVDIT